MIALGIETSGTVGSVALVDESRAVLDEVTFEKGLRHGAALVPSIEAILARAGLAKAAIDLFVAGTGPGSYTGLRVGIATAKALAFALKKPAVGVPSFDALAAALEPEALVNPETGEEARMIIVATDARRDRFYTGRYDPKTRARLGIFAVVPATLLFAGALLPATLAGSGLERHPKLLEGGFWEAHAPARVLARLGIEAFQANPKASLHDVKPLYLTPGLAGAED